jgi:hypothetical protein
VWRTNKGEEREGGIWRSRQSKEEQRPVSRKTYAAPMQMVQDPTRRVRQINGPAELRSKPESKCQRTENTQGGEKHATGRERKERWNKENKGKERQRVVFPPPLALTNKLRRAKASCNRRWQHTPPLGGAFLAAGKTNRLAVLADETTACT